MQFEEIFFCPELVRTPCSIMLTLIPEYFLKSTVTMMISQRRIELMNISCFLFKMQRKILFHMLSLEITFGEIEKKIKYTTRIV